MAVLKFDRRHWLAGAASAITGCTSTSQAPRPQVSVLKAASYSIDLVSLIRKLITSHKLQVKGKRIVLKPNLVEFDPARPINTNPVMVHAALEAFLAEGASDVRIAEGPGHRRPVLDMTEAAGYFNIIRNFESRFTDLNWADVTRVSIPKPNSTLKELYLPNLILGCDLLVSMPKLKTHHWVGATLSMKNLFGIVPGAIYGWPKNPLHWAGISEVVADLQQLVPPTFAIVDGIVGMQGNGPIEGTAKSAGVIVAGSDFPSVDATCCRIMGINPHAISYLNLVRKPAQLEAASIEQLAESPASLRSDFQLLPHFADIRLS